MATIYHQVRSATYSALLNDVRSLGALLRADSKGDDLCINNIGD